MGVSGLLHVRYDGNVTLAVARLRGALLHLPLVSVPYF
jgi:hypothetical protein